MRWGAKPKRACAGSGWQLALSGLLACTPLKPGNVLPDAGGGKAGLCAHAEPPGRPEPSARSDVSEQDYVFALRRSDVGDSTDSDGTPRYKRMGYDLDGMCTGQGQGPGCSAPSWQPPSVEDELGGRDNSANYLFFQVAGLPLSADQRPFPNIEADADSGRATVVLRLRGYNGEADDERVELAAFSVSMWPTQTEGPRPRWDGQDAWRAASPWLERAGDGSLSNDRPLFRDSDAYVAGGTFVARLPSILVGFAYVPADVWRRVIITGRLEASDGGLTVQDGIMTGRWPVDSLLDFLTRQLGPEPGTTVCSELNAVVRDLFCNRVDVSSESEDPASACDAISIVFGFTALAAQLGEPLEIPDVVSPDCQVLDCNDDPLAPRD